MCGPAHAPVVPAKASAGSAACARPHGCDFNSSRQFVAVILSAAVGTTQPLVSQRYSGYAKSDSCPAASTAATETKYGFAGSTPRAVGVTTALACPASTPTRVW